MPLLLAGDVGGTTTRLGLFAAEAARPRAIVTREFTTRDFDGLASMVTRFMREAGERGAVEVAAFGVAGPVVGGTARMTNVPWVVDAARLARDIHAERIAVVNDLVAMGHAIDVLREDETAVLQSGHPAPDGNRAVIAAGTGLGEALVLRVEGRFVPCASEGGHADFAARNDLEIALMRSLAERYGRATVEHVVSGPGLVNLYRFTHERAAARCADPVDLDNPEAPAAISAAALARRCASCTEALDLFVAAYGSEAGNLALRTVATSGVYLGGGIAPKILEALRTGTFLDAFRAKYPFEGLLTAIPLRVILAREAGLLGAATLAASKAKG